MLAAKAMGYDSRPMIGFGRPNDPAGFCPRKTLEKAAA
jgi:nitroreductase